MNFSIKFDEILDIVAKSSGQWNQNGIPIIFNLITFDCIECFIQIEPESGAENWDGYNDAIEYCKIFNKNHKNSYSFDEYGIKQINLIIECITNDWDAKFDFNPDDSSFYGNLY